MLYLYQATVHLSSSIVFSRGDQAHDPHHWTRTARRVPAPCRTGLQEAGNLRPGQGRLQGTQARLRREAGRGAGEAGGQADHRQAHCACQEGDGEPSRDRAHPALRPRWRPDHPDRVARIRPIPQAEHFRLRARVAAETAPSGKVRVVCT